MSFETWYRPRFSLRPGACPVSYNRWSTEGKEFSLVTRTSELFRHMPDPIDTSCQSIDIYYPPFAKFRSVDSFFVYHSGTGKRQVCCYQLKSGKKTVPQRLNDQPMNATLRKFVVRGLAGEAKQKEGWEDVDDKTIEQFFGVSGREWTPKKWLEFRVLEEEE